MGTSPEAIDLAEDRDRFAAVLDELGIVYPTAGMASTYQEACVVADRIGFTLLVRPSNVLGGRGMGIVYDGAQLEKYMAEAAKISPDHPVYLDRFLEGAVEVDLDALCDGEQVFVGGVLEHLSLIHISLRVACRTCAHGRCVGSPCSGCRTELAYAVRRLPAFRRLRQRKKRSICLLSLIHIFACRIASSASCSSRCR